MKKNNQSITLDDLSRTDYDHIRANMPRDIILSGEFSQCPQHDEYTQVLEREMDGQLVGFIDPKRAQDEEE